jgi:glycosyltransferase involved in cell wall biosynthesis
VRVISEAARSVFGVLPPSDEMTETLSRFKLKQNEDFLLYVGGISPHKNLHALIKSSTRLYLVESFQTLN